MQTRTEQTHPTIEDILALLTQLRNDSRERLELLTKLSTYKGRLDETRTTRQ